MAASAKRAEDEGLSAELGVMSADDKRRFHEEAVAKGRVQAEAKEAEPARSHSVQTRGGPSGIRHERSAQPTRGGWRVATHHRSFRKPATGHRIEGDFVFTNLHALKSLRKRVRPAVPPTSAGTSRPAHPHRTSPRPRALRVSALF
eukprot:scaffold16886_cov101-Isochrysis_galbana.AAC.2